MKSINAKVKLDGLKVIPEEMIIHCASKLLDDNNNSFKYILETAHEFRMAGLTPVYLCTSSLKDVYVTTEENIKQEYH